MRSERRAILAASMLTLLMLGDSAEARVYAVPIRVQDEDDLRELVDEGLIEEGDYQTLLELLDDPLDLNSASRSELFDLPGLTQGVVGEIIKSRRDSGGFAGLRDLKRLPGMSEDLMTQIGPFVTVLPRERVVDKLDGIAKMRITKDWSPVEVVEDDHPNRTHNSQELGKGDLPNVAVSTKVRYSRWLEAGFVGLAHERIRTVSYDPHDQRFTAQWGAPALELGKVYLSADRGPRSGIVGNYTAGFGLGLTFDTTSRTRPRGWYKDMTYSTDMEDGDFRVSSGLFGVAGQLESASMGDLRIDATVFLSSNRRDIYQYDMGLANREEVDTSVEDLELSSPEVYLEGQRMGYATLPNAYREDLVGGHARVHAGGLTSFGLTAYMGQIDRTSIKGVDDQYDWVIRSGWPVQDRFGAVGADIEQHLGPVEAHAEITQSFTGGQGLLGLALFELGRTDFELSARQYSTDFDNPHARGLAAADEYLGMRDRDERGGKLKVQSWPTDWLQFRGLADVWQNISLGRTNAEVYGLVEFDPPAEFRWSVSADHRNRDLANNARTYVYGGDYEDDLEDEGLDYVVDPEDATDSVTGKGAKHWVATQVTVTAVPKTNIQAFVKRTYEDAGLVYPTGGQVCEAWYQIGQQAWVKVRVKPIETNTVTWRAKYVDEDVHGSLGDRQFDTYLQVDQALPARWKIGVRGRLVWDLEDTPAEWDASCDRAGYVQPENGTCLADLEVDEESTGSTPPSGLAVVTVEKRF